MIASDDQAAKPVIMEPWPGTDPTVRRAAFLAAGSLGMFLAATFWPLGATPQAAPPFVVAGTASGTGFALEGAPFDPSRRAAGGIEPLPIEADDRLARKVPIRLPPPALAGLLMEAETPKVLFALDGLGWKGVGESVLDWTVVEVGTDRVVLRRDGQDVSLMFRDAVLLH